MLTSEALFGFHKYPGYWATVDGRIYSERAGRFLSPIRMGAYTGLQVASGGRIVKRYLHRLILEIFTGECPAGMHACHNNGNRADNRLSNLRWATPAENNADKRRHGTATDGARNPMAKLTPAGVAAIRNRVAAGETQRSLCVEYGVSPMTISRAVRGKTWSHQ